MTEDWGVGTAATGRMPTKKQLEFEAKALRVRQAQQALAATQKAMQAEIITRIKKVEPYPSYGGFYVGDNDIISAHYRWSCKGRWYDEYIHIDLYGNIIPDEDDDE